MGTSRKGEAPVIAACCAGTPLVTARSFRCCVAPPAVVDGLLMASAASTSRLIIRPPGPVPAIEFKLTPPSAAMRAAMGETTTRPPDWGCALVGADLPSGSGAFAVGDADCG